MGGDLLVPRCLSLSLFHCRESWEGDSHKQPPPSLIFSITQKGRAVFQVLMVTGLVLSVDLRRCPVPARCRAQALAMHTSSSKGGAQNTLQSPAS